MREIKFRSWYDDKMQINPTFKFFNSGANGRAMMLVDDWEDRVVMQYTGFKDKKGVEIFEGDVIMIDNFYHDYQDGVAINSLPDNKIEQVVFNESNGMWITDSDALYEYLTICEVIGNIYQNPELIK